MSVRALNWAFAASITNPTHKLVLCTLANYANDEDEAWPYIETLADCISAHRRTVERALQTLEKDGWITRKRGFMIGWRGGGLRKTNSVFRLHIPGQPPAKRTGRPLLVSGETPSQVQCDTGVVLVEDVNETPSQVQCDTGVVLVDQCGTGVGHQCDTGVALYKEEPSSRTFPPYPPTPATASRPVAGEGTGQDQMIETKAKAEVESQVAGAGLGEGVLGVGVGAGVVRRRGQGRKAVKAQRRAAARVAASNPVAPHPAKHLSEASNSPQAAQKRQSGTQAASSVSGPSGRRGGPSSEDWSLVRQVVPLEMQAVDGGSVVEIADRVRGLVAAGWRTQDVTDALTAGALPTAVKSMGRLVLYRLQQLPVDLPPPQCASRVPECLQTPVVDEVSRGHYPLYMTVKALAKAANAPEARNPFTWWLERFPGISDVLLGIPLKQWAETQIANYGWSLPACTGGN